MAEQAVYAILKVLKERAHAEDMMAGRLRFSTLRHFHEYKDADGGQRGDPNEGLVGWMQPDQVRLTIGSHVVDSSDLAAPVAIHLDEVLQCYVFCMFSLDARGHESIDADSLAAFQEQAFRPSDLRSFGEHVVLITNASVFRSRVQQACSRIASTFRAGTVDYFDEQTHHGMFRTKANGFHKCARFAHQREYRFLFQPHQAPAGDSDAVAEPWHYVDVGNLSDVAVVTTLHALARDLVFHVPDGTRA